MSVMHTMQYPVLWSEGLFMLPQHFQAQAAFDRWHSEQGEQALQEYAWGWSTLTIDPTPLGRGEIVLSTFSGILPSGTHIWLDALISAPITWKVAAALSDSVLFLCLPKSLKSRPEGVSEGESLAWHRVKPLMQALADRFQTPSTLQEIAVQAQNFVIKSDQESLEDFESLPIARLHALTPEGGIILDPHFIPPILHHRASPKLTDWLETLANWLVKRQEKLTGRVRGVDQRGVASINELLLLQLVNRYQVLFTHWISRRQLHPLTLFETGIQLMAELSTFTAESRAYSPRAPYQHHHLTQSFGPLMEDLQEAFQYVFEEPAIKLPMTHQGYGSMLVNVQDSKLWHSRRFVLVVRSSLALDVLLATFSRHFKVGSPAHIQEMVSLHIPGVGIRPLVMAPREIPFQSQCAYFELDISSTHFKKMIEAGCIALHLAKEIPHFHCELWAIKQ